MRSYASIVELQNELKKYHTPPPEALKEATRRGGFKLTAISPQWRILAMNELFGPCGIGWWMEYEAPQWQVFDFGQAKPIVCYIKGRLRYRYLDKSTGQVIEGTTSYCTGGTSAEGALDELIKMSETDCSGKCMSLLGIAASVYLGVADDDKYTRPVPEPRQESRGRSQASSNRQEAPKSQPARTRAADAPWDQLAVRFSKTHVGKTYREAGNADSSFFAQELKRLEGKIEKDGNFRFSEDRKIYLGLCKELGQTPRPEMSKGASAPASKLDKPANTPAVDDGPQFVPDSDVPF